MPKPTSNFVKPIISDHRGSHDKESISGHGRFSQSGNSNTSCQDVLKISTKVLISDRENPVLATVSQTLT